MIKCNDGEVNVSGDLASVMTDLSLTVRAINDMLLNSFERRTVRKMLMCAMDLGIVPEDKLGDIEKSLANDTKEAINKQLSKIIKEGK